jgi:hypothetical protein
VLLVENRSILYVYVAEDRLSLFVLILIYSMMGEVGDPCAFSSWKPSDVEWSKNIIAWSSEYDMHWIYLFAKPPFLVLMCIA